MSSGEERMQLHYENYQKFKDVARYRYTSFQRRNQDIFKNPPQMEYLVPIVLLDY